MEILGGFLVTHHPYHTSPKSNTGRYMCDKQCVGWKSRNICAHCLAVAEEDKQLKNFLIWFRTTKNPCTTNLTKAVYHGTYKHAGQKKPPRRKYGNTVHVPLDQKTDRIPLLMQMLQDLKMSTAMLKQLQTSPMTTQSMK